MRLWSLHPKYLDTKGLLALWREALLAQEVLRGNNKGYRHHPQLERFKATNNPLSSISTYLLAVYREATKRGYKYDASKIGPGRITKPLPVTDRQLKYELVHLRKKIAMRDRKFLINMQTIECPDAHPLFEKIPGPIEPWERTKPT